MTLKNYDLCKAINPSGEQCKQQTEEFDTANARLLIYSFFVGCTENFVLTSEYKNNPRLASQKCFEETKNNLGRIPHELANIEKELK